MTYLEVLWSYILVSAPYLLFGLLISGAIHELIPIETVKKWLGAKSYSSIFKASAVGVPLPLCSCSVIPTAVTLRKSGASNGATSSFLISTPESGVDSISITYALMDLPMTIIRPIAAFCSAFIAGSLHFWLNDFEYTSDENEQITSCCGSKKKEQVPKRSLGSRVKGILSYGFGKLSDDISVWLTVGILMGALINLIVPENFFTEMGMIQNRLMILLIGIPLYICASASTPIAVSLMLKGLSPGSALLFLLVGPATNISNIAVLQKYIGKKGVIINILSISVVALIFSFVVDFLYLNFFKLSLNPQLSSHNHEGHIFETICSVILIVVLFKGIYKEKIAHFFSKKQSSCH